MTAAQRARVSDFGDPDTHFPLCDCRSLSDDDTVGVCAGPATCEPNCLLPSTLTYFDDYYSDDIAATGIQTFFEGLRGVTSSSYILMAVDRPGSLWGAWCSSNADFFLQSYLSLSSTGGNVYSGAWEKYYRNEGACGATPCTKRTPITLGHRVAAHIRGVPKCSSVTTSTCIRQAEVTNSSPAFQEPLLR